MAKTGQNNLLTQTNILRDVTIGNDVHVVFGVLNTTTYSHSLMRGFAEKIRTFFCCAVITKHVKRK